MNKQNHPSPWVFVRACMFLLVVGLLVPKLGRAQLIVDCTGATPGAYPSINAALSASGLGTAIFLVAGPCTEDLQIAGATDLFIGTYYGQPNVVLNGKISIGQSHGVYLHGLNITSANGDGINVQQSQALIIDTCTSNGNAGNGLNLGAASEASVIGPASFDGNTGSGIYLFGNSYAQLNTWNGQAVDVSNNHSSGVWASQSSFTTYGLTTISNNLNGYGVQLFGGTRSQFGSLTGANTISGNQLGGVSLQENSEISMFNFGSQTYVQNNGPVGVTAGFNSQVTLYDTVEISGHTGPALDLFGNSQAYVFGATNIHNNGVASDSRSAAIRVDGNSEVFLRGGNISQNLGPAILALVNSSADFTGTSFSSNSGGIISCDTSAFMVSDLTKGLIPAPGVSCRTPHNLGNHVFTKRLPVVPDWNAVKSIQAKYMKMATRK